MDIASKSDHLVRSLLKEEDTVFITRRSPEERKKNWKIAIYRQVKQYMKGDRKGDLDLQGTPITSLPDGLTVGGNLDLDGTPITSLPDGLTVGGDLGLFGTPVTSLPDGLTVGGYLDLYGTPITSLPDGLTVGGNLVLYGTPLAKLSDEEIRRGRTIKGEIWR